MNILSYREFFSRLMRGYRLPEEDIIFVGNIADWCKEHEIPETDAERPFKLVSKKGLGCKLLISEYIPDEAIEQRINALRIRSQMKNVAFDRVDLLNSDEKKLTYLLLSEYASTLPETGSDDFLSDDWTFEEMEQLGFFRE